MLLGLIVYISVFKAEVGSKLRPQSQIRPPLFEYEYGYSFLMYIIGLFSTKLSGVGCVFLFMYRYEKKCFINFENTFFLMHPFNNYKLSF